jgi:hypothetical protein
MSINCAEDLPKFPMRDAIHRVLSLKQCRIVMDGRIGAVVDIYRVS